MHIGRVYHANGDFNSTARFRSVHIYEHLCFTQADNKKRSAKEMETFKPLIPDNLNAYTKDSVFPLINVISYSHLP